MIIFKVVLGILVPNITRYMKCLSYTVLQLNQIFLLCYLFFKRYLFFAPYVVLVCVYLYAKHPMKCYTYLLNFATISACSTMEYRDAQGDFL